MEQTILTVSQLTNTIQRLFADDPRMRSLCVRGEISNYKLYPSGHHYFTLKDDKASIKCVMFRSDALSLRFQPEHGMEVLAFGSVSVFPRDGVYQLYCRRLHAAGVGDLHFAYEQLRRKLEAEGLFDPAHKKPLPAFPRRIAVVTSPAGKAIHDILEVLRQRYPLAKVLLLPASVQGEDAPPEIAAQIRFANKHALADVIITGRGGGSLEELWAFNDERVARAIYESKIPVISAVGHEPDVTIADYVADVRATTPTNAAMLVAPNRKELLASLDEAGRSLQKSAAQQLSSKKELLETIRGTYVLQNPLNFLRNMQLRLDNTDRDLRINWQAILAQKKQEYTELAARLDAMSPMKVLARGYSVCMDAEGRLIKDVTTVSLGENIVVYAENGRIGAVVDSISGREDTNEKEHQL